MHVIPRDIVCTFHPDVGQNLTCSVNQREKLNGTFSADFLFKRPVNNILVRFGLFLPADEQTDLDEDFHVIISVQTNIFPKSGTPLFTDVRRQ